MSLAEFLAVDSQKLSISFVYGLKNWTCLSIVLILFCLKLVSVSVKANMSILWRDPLCWLTAQSIVSSPNPGWQWVARWMLMNLRQIISSSSKTVQNKLFCHNNHQLYVGKRRKRWTKSWKNKSIVLTSHNKILYLWQYLYKYFWYMMMVRYTVHHYQGTEMRQVYLKKIIILFLLRILLRWL